MPALAEILKAACPFLRLQEPLSRHTSLAIGGPADYYADVSTRDELIALRRVLQKNPLPVFFLGAGSNVLVSDRGIRGVVIHLQGQFREAAFDGPLVAVGAGTWMPTLVKQCAERGLSGIESLIGVPGTIGGGLVMNAGTREGVLGDVVQSVEVLDAESRVKTFSLAEIQFDYRRSTLENQWILGAVLRLKPDERSIIMSRVDALLQYRARTQPLGTSNCGSVFKNPPGNFAARLIEQAGLKGRRCGGAQISERHANFIVNVDKATAQDVQALVRLVKQTVFDKFTVTLEPEIKLAGEW